MADQATSTRSTLIDGVRAPFDAFVRLIWSLTEAQEMNREASEVLNLSDAELAARGLTRQGAILTLTRKYAHI